MKTINSGVSRITKLAPNIVTKKDVAQLVFLSAETPVSRKPCFYVGDFVRIAKKDKIFRKGYEQLFTNEVFEIKDILTLFLPSYSLIDANKDQIEGKFYHSEFSLFVNGNE